MHIAARQGVGNAVQFLVAAGVSIVIEDYLGNKALDLLPRKSPKLIPAFTVLRDATKKQLEKKGVNVEQKRDPFSDPLRYMPESGNTQSKAQSTDYNDKYPLIPEPEKDLNSSMADPAKPQKNRRKRRHHHHDIQTSKLTSTTRGSEDPQTGHYHKRPKNDPSNS